MIKRTTIPLKLNKPYIYGFHAVREALRNPKRSFKNLYLTKDILETFHPGIAFKIVSKEALNLTLGEDVVHQGIVLETTPLPIAYMEDILANAPKSCQILILDQVSDPHNIGAIARSAAAFGVRGIIQQDKNAPDFSSPVITKIASGAMEHISFVTVPNLSRAIEELQKNDFWVIGLDERGEEPIDSIQLAGRIAFVMGREGKGLRRLVKESCDHLVQLPTNPQFPTLNVANAAAVTLYEWVRQNKEVS